MIPTYNRARLIVAALDSVVAQSYRPLEILVVDDGSTDETEAVVARWASQQLTVSSWQSPEDKEKALTANRSSSSAKATADMPLTEIRYLKQANLGGNPARNHGIREASGELIAFLDSDDAWEPDKLEKQVLKFEDPGVVAVYCGVRHLNFETGEALETTKRTYPEGNLLEALLIRDVTVQTSAYVVRKEVFDKVGAFDETLQARQDWDMWIRVASAGKIGCVPEALVRFREHAGLRTASNPMKEITAYRRIRQKYATLLKESSLSCRLQARAAYFKRMGRVHHKHPELDSGKGRFYAFGALLNWPFDFDNYAALGGMFLPRNFRQSLHRSWNAVFGATPLAIRSH